MKTLIALLIALPVTAAQAGLSFDDCSSAPPMAILAKDNMPYYPAHSPNVSVKGCYDAVTVFIKDASSDQITAFQDTYTQVEIFNNDEDFMGFVIKNRALEEETYEPFTIEYPEYDTITPAFVPDVL